VFPRNGRDDPVLGDGLRRELRKRYGKPIPIKSGAAEEERLLLSLVVGSATERVDLSWQRADESGRAKTPTLALREIARMAYGRPDLDEIHRAARHLPSHPSQWLEELAAEPGLLTPDDEQVLAALHSRTEAASLALAERFPKLAGGLALLRATQAFHFVDPAYDGRIGPVEDSRRLSVSALETLGRCPLQFFFARVLRVGELDQAASAFELASQDVGTEIHETLERIYESLLEEKLFETGTPEQLETRALELLEQHRTGILGPSGERLLRRLPVLWELQRDLWFEALRAFLEIDLDRLAHRKLRPVGLEEFREVEIDFGDSVVQAVGGRFDRVLEGANGLVVGDYKTSGKLADRVNPTQMLKGQRLQVPLYRRIAGEGVHVELLGVGPTFDPERARETFEGFPKPELEAGFDDTMRTLLGLRSKGVFPLLPNKIYCEWCRYEQACRRNHPPTLDREEHDPDSLELARIRKKSTRNLEGR
jgi:ATP-dependent helicase/nuclease subunit B